jgi:hypothetical protein
MGIPLRCAHPLHGLFPALRMALLGTALVSCTTLPEGGAPVDLGSPQQQQVVGLQQGRVTVVVVDEQGISMPGMRVDLLWEEPSFYRTFSFTNRAGEVTFSGVPAVAEIRIDHPTGIYTRTLLVPQTGRPELRVMLDTMGESELMRERERSRLLPPGSTPATR